MSKNVQLHIPAPCHEDWSAMRPEEQGRFCASCCKTVIDFSLMSDPEVLAYLAGAGGRICGRFTEDQLQRDLMPPQDKRKGGMIWHMLLAALLFASKGMGQIRRTPINVMGAPVRIDEPIRIVKPVRAAEPGPVRIGEPVRILPDTASPVPRFIELPPVEVIYSPGSNARVSIGGASLVSVKPIVSGKTFFSDSTMSRAARKIADTLRVLGLAKKGFSLYPNPAPRGSVIRLSISLDKPANCTIGLYNEAGTLVQEKPIETGGEQQLELFGLPASLPGGIYFVKLSSAQWKKPYTQKLLVW